MPESWLTLMGSVVGTPESVVLSMTVLESATGMDRSTSTVSGPAESLAALVKADGFRFFIWTEKLPTIQRPETDWGHRICVPTHAQSTPLSTPGGSMHRTHRRTVPAVLALLTTGVLVVGCNDGEAPTSLAPEDVATANRAAAPQGAHQGAHQGVHRNFRAQLTGDQEVPAVETRARGQTIFQVSRDGSEIRYRLIVVNLDDLHMAHIHVGAAGVNGPVVVWLYPDAPPPQPIAGRTTGILATGVITAENLVGPWADEPLETLLDAMADGSVYVNVHTIENPGGEIRGQITP
jgi:hypothetical protein